ncbi:MAG: tRNA threonylcarbamoyladenosine dehydratase [Eubacteriales bacterium]|nr:tRNA threonylcarbamoyladenosine dehydratase [Eubacteriales bacterium]
MEETEKKQLFLREKMLLGDTAMEKLEKAHVAVFGLGGVGSWCAESLVRAGIGNLTLIDSDSFSLTNINRQSGALISTVGKMKADVMAERLRDINPFVCVKAVNGLYKAENREKFFPVPGETEYSFVADCIDLVSAKLDLIMTCREKAIPIISALGTGNKADAQQLVISDISKTSGDALARVMRKELRAREIVHHPVVYSPEEPMNPEQIEAPPPGRRSVPGSLVWVPASAGLLMAQYIVMNIIED